LNMDEVFSSEEVHDMHDKAAENQNLVQERVDGLTN